LAQADLDISYYLDSLGEVSRVSPEEEAALTIRIREGDIDARDQLVEANLPFVVSVAVKYRGRGVPLADLISAGNLGLIKATELFDETRGFKFISYAVWWIRQSIQQALNETTRMIRQPENRIDAMARFLRFAEEFRKINERSPSDEEIAAEFDLKEDKILALKMSNQKVTSLDRPILEEGSSLMALVPDESSLAPDAAVTHSVLRERIDEVIATLSHREAEVIRQYFALDGEAKTLQEIGEELGLTRERVRQIKARALDRLRFRFRAANLSLEDAV
jgi:RNA polymerase primary sigma factor